MSGSRWRAPAEAATPIRSIEGLSIPRSSGRRIGVSIGCGAAVVLRVVNDDELLALATLVLAETADAPSGGYKVVARGEIDRFTAPQLAEALGTLIRSGATLVVLDATDVRFLDSSGLRVIVNCGNELKAAGGRLLIEGMSGAVQRVLEVSGLIEHYRA
jgi:anti-sigma B factor antagonist